MQATNTRNPELEAHLRQTARPESVIVPLSQLLWGEYSITDYVLEKERIFVTDDGESKSREAGRYLGELQQKEDTDDPYVAALRGETLTRKPYWRIQPVPEQIDTVADKEHKTDKDMKK
ncbi:hypothetical protein HS088_TW21G00288 [Tripterygium wilfordii]|uniref:Uncharacterized protein n=1 Tax=Tripterygium wilfordii TaxID=458696 RepID=A0A7J7C2I8_TRIWF|nr:hypothetical protein HS088_TW21G00288 [Tripterygium wilfordii]